MVKGYVKQQTNKERKKIMAYDIKPLLDLVWRVTDKGTGGRLGGSPFAPEEIQPATGQPKPIRKPKPLFPPKHVTPKRTNLGRNSA
jgi:hypothetical protein